MSNYRILIFSDTRPARTWRFAKRIEQEIDGAHVCGIVQEAPRELSKAQKQFQSAWSSLVDSVLWLVHGCPSGAGSRETTQDSLAYECAEARCPLLQTANLNGPNVPGFIGNQQPDIAIVLGNTHPDAELLRLPRRGWLRVVHGIREADSSGLKAIGIRIESLGPSSNRPFTVTQLDLPVQTYDSPIGQTLKVDLIADDLMLQSASLVLARGEAEAVQAATDWTQQMYSPYLEQLKGRPIREIGQNAQRHRSAWKLCLDTLLLCSPVIVCKNWYRRLRRQYPVTILTHHLVSDRRHRMGIPTETFLRQVRFLRRHYRIVSLAEAVELLKSGHVKSPTVVLTFDDGYADNFVSLRAVAEETGIPITLFIATQQVEQQEEFQHDLESGIHGFLPLTWQQIRYWSKRRVEFAAHTRTHFDCGTTEQAKLEYEVLGSKTDLERHLGTPVEFFAFPFGQRENMSREAVEIATGSYDYYVSGYGGENYSRACKDNQHILRKNLYANAWEQELDLQSVFDLADTIKQKLRCLWPRAYDAPLGLHPALAASSADNGSEAELNAPN